LAHRLANEKASNEELRIKVERLEEALSHKQSDLERSQYELRRFQEEKEREFAEFLNEEKRKLNEAKESALERESRLSKAWDNEKKELVANYERNIRDLQAKVENLTKNNQELIEAK